LKVSDFEFDLPADAIAQEPAPRRGDSRLLVLNRESGARSHRRFRDLPGELAPGDLVVLNDTKVIPARLRGCKPTGGQLEMLLVEPVGEDRGAPVWRALLDGSRTLSAGMTLTFPAGLTAVTMDREGDVWRVKLVHDRGDPMGAIEAVGEMPLPPYVRRVEDDARARSDRERYQTVYAKEPGAIAAPTAGLHFTSEMLDALRADGVAISTLTLHVGLGTFLPIRVDRVEAHVLHEEAYRLPEATSEAIAATRRSGGRVVAVGTTVARVLESCAIGSGRVRAGAGRSSLFIYPGFRFSVVDALVTNFHLPRSTLLMLVCAFAGTEQTLGAYREAVREGYRFYSYGDAMLVRPA
jgi:S-adenosylmethionine:tRNA ribosyltransferase-isomerase